MQMINALNDDSSSSTHFGKTELSCQALPQSNELLVWVYIYADNDISKQLELSRAKVWSSVPVSTQKYSNPSTSTLTVLGHIIT